MDTIFNSILEKETKVERKKAIIHIKNKNFFDASSVNEITMRLKYLTFNYNDIKIKIQIDTNYIADMATITVLEYVIFSALKLSDNQIKISFWLEKGKFNEKFFTNSLLGEFARSCLSFEKSREIFIRKFTDETTLITQTHYRKLLKNGAFKNDDLESKLFTEINFFLINELCEEYKANYSEAIVELCGNALEHTSSDCIISMECGKAIDVEDKSEHNILAVVISNVSCDLLHDRLKQLHETKSKEFPIIDQAIKSHEKVFNDKNHKYCKDMFYMVSAFQNGISTRKNQTGSGGTGLCKAVSNIFGRTSEDHCYLLTGNEILFLKENKICTEKGYIGFNNKHTYLNGVPDDDMIGKCAMYYNGTLIHLMLALDKEDNYDDKINI